MLALTAIVFIFTIIGLYGGDSLPATHMFSAALAFLLPVLCILNILLVIYWIFRRKWFILVPILALFFARGYIGTIFQIRFSKGDAEGAITFATYNVRGFNRDNTGLQAQDIKAMMVEEGVDVICLQEYYDQIGNEDGLVTAKFCDVYPYSARGRKGDMIILSRYPITTSKDSVFEYSNNSFQWADVKMPTGKTVRVFNVHMETTGVNQTLHQAAKQQGGDMARPDYQNAGIYKALLGNYVFNLNVRSGQSIIVANEKARSPHPIVLCGDFNDVPYSFTYNTLLGDLKDGFRQGGSGFMFTYRGAKGVFRIDYIFHDESMQSVDYYKMDKNYSDHNPVVSRIRME